jgi:hypothetical protein
VEPGEATKTVTPVPPSVSPRSIAGFRWEGDVPWQKWSQIYSKVFSRFSQKGLRLRLVVEVVPSGGVSEQELEETRAALKELGISDEVKAKQDEG